VQSNNKEEIAGMISYPAVGSAFGQANPHTEETGIAVKLRIHLY
jgi:hypothetical protein